MQYRLRVPVWLLPLMIFVCLAVFVLAMRYLDRNA
jgi:hypothetical protein